MNVNTITMDPQLAKAKLDAYLADKHADTREAYAQCAKGYEALAEGKILLHLDASIRGGGFFESGFPKLAIARADRREVRFQWRGHETSGQFDCRNQYYSQRGNPGTLLRTVDFARPHNIFSKYGDGRSYARDLNAFAQVPLLPADVRPEQGQLRDWFILWEVERWYASSKFEEPPRDPLLLEHVAGQLYAVLAEWDLTELERAVQAGALRPEATA